VARSCNEETERGRRGHDQAGMAGATDGTAAWGGRLRDADAGRRETSMGIFVTSTGSGRGADLGGMAGADMLAQAAGPGAPISPGNLSNSQAWRRSCRFIFSFEPSATMMPRSPMTIFQTSDLPPDFLTRHHPRNHFTDLLARARKVLPHFVIPLSA